MKTAKLLDRISEYLALTPQERRKQRAQFEVVLEKLKKKEHKKRHKLAEEGNELKRRQLELEVESIHIQRKRGLGAYKDAKRRGRGRSG